MGGKKERERKGRWSKDVIYHIYFPIRKFDIARGKKEGGAASSLFRG